MDSAMREPKRIELDYARWSGLSAETKESFYAECDREIEDIGIVILAGALSEEVCDRFIRLIDHEIQTAAPIERKINEARLKIKGYNVYNLQNRHPELMELIHYAPVVTYFRRFLGDDMKLYSSEGRVNPPGTGDAGWHYDGFDRVPNYYLSMNSIYYLVDSTKTNGSTMIVPGTHKQFLPVAEAAKGERHYLNVKKGDAVLFNPYLIHAGSANGSDRNRPVIINYYVRSYIRQDFDYPGMMSHAEAKKLTEEQRILLGFDNRPGKDIADVCRIAGVEAYDPYGY